MKESSVMKIDASTIEQPNYVQLFGSTSKFQIEMIFFIKKMMIKQK